MKPRQDQEQDLVTWGWTCALLTTEVPAVNSQDKKLGIEFDNPLAPLES